MKVVFLYVLVPNAPIVNGDIVFLIDSSSSVDTSQYLKQKDSVKSLARYLNVRPGLSRASLITYGSTSSKVIGFDGYSTVSEFDTAVDSAGRVGGPRRIDYALEAAKDALNEARPNVPKVSVLTNFCIYIIC
jgi:hypothetical protein